jgi:hypothetical protein
VSAAGSRVHTPHMVSLPPIDSDASYTNFESSRTVQVICRPEFVYS